MQTRTGRGVAKPSAVQRNQPPCKNNGQQRKATSTAHKFLLPSPLEGEGLGVRGPWKKRGWGARDTGVGRPVGTCFLVIDRPSSQFIQAYLRTQPPEVQRGYALAALEGYVQ
jgi:hypothetical protein